MLNATHAAFGDLTGDGRAEAVVEASCATSAEGLTSGHGQQLLVVTRADDGTLVGLGWAGPPSAEFLSYWVSDRRLLIDADPGTTNAEDHFPHVPGLALTYQWDGGQLTGWDPAPEYPAIVPLDPEQTGAPVRLRPAVASGLGCPDVELRLVSSSEDWGGTQRVAGATYTVPARYAQLTELTPLDE